ncbi:MAG: ankyrin repeat domain-containing protein [Acidimicrobiia bacterium]
MKLISADDPLAVTAAAAAQAGDLIGLERLLNAHPDLATARIGEEECSRTLLHAATDWPGHFPNVASVIALLVAAGADVNARWHGQPAEETPLHWAASSNDVVAIDALLDHGADVEANGAVLGGGNPLADACGFGNWEAAHRLVNRGARPRLKDAAALGLVDRLEAAFAALPHPDQDDVTKAFWSACHGGQREAAEFLLEQGADINWVGWDGLTPLEMARRSGMSRLVGWLSTVGGRSADA